MKTLESGMTREEVAKFTTFSLSKVDALIASGELPAAKVGRRVVVQPRHVRELLEKNTQEAKMHNEQEIAAVTVLRAVEYRMQGDGAAMTRALRGTNREVSLRLLEATEIIAHLLQHSDRPEQLFALLLKQVSPCGNNND